MWLCPNCKQPFPKQPAVVHCSCGIVTGELVLSHGPGSELSELFKSLRFKRAKQCGCRKLQLEMDQLGVEGCRLEFNRLVSVLREKYAATTWTERIRAGS